MTKNSNLHDNFLVNIYLRGFNSVQIGVYFILVAYLFKGMITGFTSDGHFMLFMSAQWIEILGWSLFSFFVVLSLFALFFSSRRNARKFHYALWNSTTKGYFWRFLLGLIVGVFLLYFLLSKGMFNYLAPGFFLMYALLLLLLKKKNRSSIYSLLIVSFCLAIVCFVFPAYWYSSLSILGVAHIVFGMMVRN